MSKPVRVVHISSAHRDGDIRIFHKECVSLAAAGFEVFLIIPGAKDRIENGVSVMGLNPRQGRLSRFTKAVNEAYRKAKELKADIYHIHDPELLRIAPKLMRVGKVIYDAHEDLPRQILTKEYIWPIFRRMLARTIENYENRIARRVTAVVTATPHIRDRFLKLNPKTIDINNFPLDREISVQQLPSANREMAVCYIGAISEIRGILQLIEGCHLAGTKLYLAGDMEPGMDVRCKQTKGWSNVSYLGLIDRKSSLELKSKCLAGMVPFLAAENHIHAQPNKIFEYMASGLPVICSDFQLWRDIVEVNHCGICADSSRPAEIARAIEKLKADSNQVQKMGENGINLVQTKFNWKNEEKKLIAFYQQLLNQ